MPAKNLFHFLLSFILTMPLLATGQITQWVVGHVTDRESKTPLTGVRVQLNWIADSTQTTTDSSGGFAVNGVPVGRALISLSYPGYYPLLQWEVWVTSAKQTLVQLELSEASVKMKEVTVVQQRGRNNEMALVSATTFDMRETERYAGSRADPARMASNYAGVQGGNDSRNDIVVRGNTPQGVIWRLEGIDIPNPNHFAIPGTTGGPVSMLNSKTLGRSDFFTGAFPAGYGNGIAAVFDVKLRPGNTNEYEYSAQFGLLGTELAAEGPINRKKRSSLLVAYRYSTLQIFESFNIKTGTSSTPRYQDLTFKFNFPLSARSTFSIFGIGGTSGIDLEVSKLTKPVPELYGESDRDQYFTSNTGIGGMAYQHHFNKNTYTELTLAQTGNDVIANHYKVFRDNNYQVDSLKHILGYNYKLYSTVFHGFVQKKLSPTQTFRAGVINNYYFADLLDSSRQYPTTLQQWQHRTNYRGGTNLLEAYAQYKVRPTEKLTLNIGLHTEYLSHNSSTSVEPRLSLRWKSNSKTTVTAGYGLHSQMQPLYQYFAHLPSAAANQMHNYNVGFTRSHHLVAGIERTTTGGLRAKVEGYGQYLFNVPIEKRIGSSYSALNQGSSYSRDFPDSLYNKGTGYNYGAELTLEQRMKQGIYTMLSASWFTSKAKGNDGVYRNTDFNTHYAVNFLAGYERHTGRYGTFVSGLKVTFAGGKPYSAIDTAASLVRGDAVAVDTLRNRSQLKPYFRADLKLAYKVNTKKLTHEVGIDLVNLLNTKNVLSYTYSYDLATQGKNPFYYQYQLGFLPVFYYRADFGGHHK